MKKPKCRHRRCWLIAGGRIAWCYQCGAWRQGGTRPDAKGIYATGAWHPPTGPGGHNPWEESIKADEAYRKRYL